jgi:prolyl oligopeptidase
MQLRARSSWGFAVAGLVMCSFLVAAAPGPGDPLSPIGLTTHPPVAPVRPVTDTLYGTPIVDPYRWMESLDSEAIGYIRAQGAYTRSILDAIRPRAALLTRISDFGAGFGFVESYEAYGGRGFYLLRAPGSDNYDLMVRDAKGTRKIVDVAALRAAHGGEPYAINYFQASPDGAKVAVGISAGGSEDASLFVYDASSGAVIAGPVDRAQFGSPFFSPDGRTVFFTRLAKLKPGDAPTEKYRNSTTAVWDMHAEPVDLIGAALGHGPRLTPDEIPVVVVVPGASHAIFLNVNGVQNEQELWIAPVAVAARAATQWQKLVARSDSVTQFDMRGSEIFLLSHQNAATFKVLALRVGQPLSAARTIVAARPDRVVESIHAASDALYVIVREGVYSRLLRIPASGGGGAAEDVALPFKGYVSAVFSDERRPGLTITVESWVVPPTQYTYDPATKRVTPLSLGVQPAYDPAAFEVRDLSATAHDGVQVPLTLIAPRGLIAAGPQIVLMNAYGSYGISQLPTFSTHSIPFMREGAETAVCHVRGGGELGEAWRLGGKDANKPNTWRDLIACGEDLIARGITTKEKLFIYGGSAGGITMGRALTERPDLFAGVIDLVPAANTLRSEFTPNGPPNIPEFGTVKTEAGFRNLLEMDSYQAIKDGTQYPPVLVATGLNDPRVSPWEPAKFTARLQASGTVAPVLLRVDDAAGHGIGSTKTQSDALYADMVSFVFWRAGRADWRPDLTVRK